MKRIKIKNVLVFACTVPLLLLADMLGYIVINLPIKALVSLTDYKDIGMWLVQFFVYMFLVMTTIYLLICLGTIINDEKNKQKFLLIFLLVLNLVFLWCTPTLWFISKEHLAIIVWLITDTIIAWIISSKFDELKIKSFFKTTKITKTYRKYGKEIKEEEKTYPVLLPILIAIISASGAIIASIITKN